MFYQFPFCNYRTLTPTKRSATRGFVYSLAWLGPETERPSDGVRADNDRSSVEICSPNSAMLGLRYLIRSHVALIAFLRQELTFQVTRARVSWIERSGDLAVFRSRESSHLEISPTGSDSVDGWYSKERVHATQSPKINDHFEEFGTVGRVWVPERSPQISSLPLYQHQSAVPD